jgi:hypothetical protein
MKKDELLILAAVGAGVFFLAKYLGGRTKNTTVAKNTGVVGPSSAWVSEIMRADGWTYYDDGTAIDPNGKYYFKGVEVYAPAGMYQ